MKEIIKQFSDNSYLEYAPGKFDRWCVYLTRPGRPRIPPKDTDCFRVLQDLAGTYGADRVYRDYIQVYEMAGKQVRDSDLDDITKLANTYGTDALRVDIVFSILYLTMIAEERKANTHLGKRIKRLGVHALLVEHNSVSDAANFMRHMKWTEIAKLCTQRGF